MINPVTRKQYKEYIELTKNKIVKLDIFLNFRIRKEDFKSINLIVKKDCETYDNTSHFIRCAILKLIRAEQTRLNLKCKNPSQLCKN